MKKKTIWILVVIVAVGLVVFIISRPKQSSAFYDPECHVLHFAFSEQYQLEQGEFVLEHAPDSIKVAYTPFALLEDIQVPVNRVIISDSSFTIIGFVINSNMKGVQDEIESRLAESDYRQIEKDTAKYLSVFNHADSLFANQLFFYSNKLKMPVCISHVTDDSTWARKQFEENNLLEKRLIRNN